MISWAMLLVGALVWGYGADAGLYLACFPGAALTVGGALRLLESAGRS